MVDCLQITGKLATGLKPTRTGMELHQPQQLGMDFPDISGIHVGFEYIFYQTIGWTFVKGAAEGTLQDSHGLTGLTGTFPGIQ
jgi:hypothetical protein